jgi:hypothetical protein
MASEHGMIHTISSNCLSARLPELAGQRRYQYQLSRLRSVAGDGHTGRQYGGYWRSPCSPGPCSIGGVVVVGGGGAGSASAADLLIGYCRSLPSSSGGSVHSPRDRCAARARKQLPPTETHNMADDVKSLLSRYCGDTNNQPEVACADRPGPLGWFQERCGRQTRLPAGPPRSPKHASRAH